MKFIFAPEWFLGKDVLIESFSFIVLFAFFFLCWRYYKLNKKKTFLHLGIGFLLIAIAQLAIIATKFVLYYNTHFTQNIGQMIITYDIVKSINIFYYAGYFFHRLLTLLGFFVIYRSTKKAPGDFLLLFYFIIVSVIFSNTIYYIFNITVLILLIMILEHYYHVYKENKSRNTLILILAFGLLAVGNLIFILSDLPTMFVLANLIGLLSYIILLVLIIRILYVKRNLKKTGKNGSKKK